MNDSNLHVLLARIEGKLDRLLESEAVKDSREIHEFAWPVDTEELTVRGRACHGAIRVTRYQRGRGPQPLRGFGREEVLRYRPDGLLPFAPSSGRVSR